MSISQRLFWNEKINNNHYYACGYFFALIVDLLVLCSGIHIRKCIQTLGFYLDLFDVFLKSPLDALMISQLILSTHSSLLSTSPASLAEAINDLPV